MKNLTKALTGVVIAASLAACAHREPPCAQSFMRTNYNPAPMPVVNQTPACNTACNGCQPSEYTIKTPVEVLYKNTTYRTVYVPQTSQSTSYEKRPYNASELCANGECAY